MPAKIIRTPDDPHNSRAVVYSPDHDDKTRTRPLGHIYYDRKTGRMMVREKVRPRYFVGLDLGQTSDYTAMAVVEKTEAGLSVSSLERVNGRPYPNIVSRVADYLSRPPLADQYLLVVDATGVGRGVVDMIRSAGISPIALTITGAARVTGSKRAPRVPKVDLIEGLLLAFQSGTIKIAAELEHAPTLSRELTELRRKISANGHVSFGVWREGEHDDLILALAMAVWTAERP